MNVKSQKPRSSAQIRADLQHARETFLGLTSNHCPSDELEERGAELRQLTERLLGLLDELAMVRERKVLS